MSMKTKSIVMDIRKRREENEPSEIICIREINDNIRRVFNGEPLTRPLRILNKNCEFKKRYDIACDLLEGDLTKEKRRAYHQKPEVKEKQRAYSKAYHQKPEVKEKRRAYHQKPEVKEKRRAYHQKPEVKEKQRAYSKAYHQKHKLEILKRKKRLKNEKS